MVMETAISFENFGPIYQTARRLIPEKVNTECWQSFVCENETRVHVNSKAYRGFFSVPPLPRKEIFINNIPYSLHVLIIR